MTATKVLLKGMNFDGSTVTVSEVVNENPLPGVGSRSYSVDTANGSHGFASYEDAERFITSVDTGEYAGFNFYGQPDNSYRTGLGLPLALFARHSEPFHDAITEATPANAPVTTASAAPTADVYSPVHGSQG